MRTGGEKVLECDENEICFEVLSSELFADLDSLYRRLCKLIEVFDFGKEIYVLISDLNLKLNVELQLDDYEDVFKALHIARVVAKVLKSLK